MSSSKIQEYNLDPNMGLAKEDTAQEILSAVNETSVKLNDGISTPQFLRIVASDNVKYTIANSEYVSEAGANVTLATVYVRNVLGTMKLSANLKTSSGATGGAIISYATYGENDSGTSNQYDGATSSGVTTYTTKTLTIDVTPDIYKIWIYLHGNNVSTSNKYYCNYATLSFDEVENINYNIII